MPDTIASNHAPGAACPAPPPAEQELEDEFYAALRAAGASAEEARSCLLDSRTPPAA